MCDIKTWNYEFCMVLILALCCISVVCTTKNADILLILDDSRSISNRDYSKMKRFVTELVYRFNISEDQSHVALIQFSSRQNTVVSFNLNRHYNKASLMSDIANLKQSDGDSTYTDVALKMAREEVGANNFSCFLEPTSRGFGKSRQKDLFALLVTCYQQVRKKL